MTRSQPSQPHRDRRRPCGFTLLEILTVLVIVTLVMAIALPMLSKARVAARKTQAASNLVAIESALAAYKTDFADYPRPDPGATGDNTGFALLGKAMFCPGPSIGPLQALAGSGPHGAGTIASVGTPGNTEYREFVAFGMPQPGGGFSTTTAPPDAGNWAGFTVSDGKDGPGFRARPGGQPYGPYLQENKFRLRGLAILDTWDNPILYFPARPTKPAPDASGVWPLLPSTATKAAAHAAQYNGFHNISFFMRPGDTATAAADQDKALMRMEAVLVVPGANDFDGSMETSLNEKPATDKAILLWSAGPDGAFGPTFAGATPTPEEMRKIDDITNFNTGP